MIASSIPTTMIHGGKTKTTTPARIRRLAIVLFAVTAVSLAGIVARVNAVSFEDVSQTLGLGTADLKDTVINIINWVLGLLGIIATIIMLYAGYLWLTSAGNEERIRRAKRIIINALIGLVIILLAWAIVNFIIKSVGEVTNPGGTQCSDGTIQGCWMCVGGSWVHNPTLPGCALQPDTFEIRNIVTSCQNPPDYRNDVYTCSGVTVVFNKVLDVTTVQSNTQNDGLTVEECEMPGSDLTTCLNPSWPTPLFNTAPLNEIEYSGATPLRNRAEIVASGRTLSFLHMHEPFRADTVYRLTIPKASQGIKDVSGKELTACEYADGSPIPGCQEFATYFSWNFRVGNQTDNAPPTLVSSYPVASGPSYPDRNVNRTAILTARFSEAMAPWTITEDNIRIFGFEPGDQPDAGGNGGTRLATPIDGTPPNPDNYDVFVPHGGDGFELVFKNGFQLDAFKWYELDVNNLTDLCSNVQTPAPITWRFQTNGVGAGIGNVYPPNNYQFACPGTEVFVRFNTSMYDPANGGCSVNPPLGFVTNGTINPNIPRQFEVEDDYPGSGNPNDYCKKYSWRPTANSLNVNSNYSVSVDTRYQINQDGDVLEADWSFRTATPETCADSPVITDLLPDEGPAGTCLSVIGNYFDPDGDNQGAGDGDNLTFSGNSALSDVHRWAQRAIVVDAPNIGLGPSPVQVSVRYPPPIGTLQSNTNLEFNFQAGTFTGPCLYQLNPDTGLRNQNYQLIGRNFNPASSTKLIHFGADTFPNNWTSDTVANSSVPNGAPQGPPPGVDSLVRVQNDDGTSNALPFSVLSVPPLTFRVIDFVPNCASACPNASVRARFSRTLTAASVTNDSVELYRCSDPTCGLGTLTEVATNLQYPGDIDVFFAESDGLDVPDVWYRAVVHGGASGVMSSDGRELGDLNFDADGAGGPDSFSWTFKTATDTDECELATVDCRPANVSIPVNGNRGLQSFAFSEPNTCNPGGEELDPWQYVWAWTSNDPTRVTVNPAAPGPATQAHGAQATLPGNPVDVQTTTEGESAICRVTVTTNTCVTDDDCINNPVVGACPGSVCLPSHVCSPTVTAINPTNGAVGDWVTVNGCYFEHFGGDSRILFLQDAANPDLPGLWPLPSVCGAPGSTWQDRQIIVEVPNKRDGDTNNPLNDVRFPGPLRVIRDADLEQADSTQFFTPGGSPNPGICRVTPGAGQAGVAQLRIQGQNFGVPPPGANDRIIFYDGTVAGAVVAGADVTWVGDTEVNGVTVPMSATNNNDPVGNPPPWAGNTNELFLENDGARSNLVNFDVIPPSCTVCSADTDCGGGATQGCGVSGAFSCCAGRPEVSDPRPLNPPLTCRNAMISASFVDAATGAPIAMDRTTISPTTVHLRNVTDGVDVPFQQSDFRYPSASSFRVIPPGLLLPGKTYRVTIDGDENITENPAIPEGVLSLRRVGMNGDAVWTFLTADTVCELARVQLMPDRMLFTGFGSNQAISAETFDDNNQPIAPIPGVYDWTWQWTPTADPVATVSDSDDPNQAVTSVGNGETVIRGTATAGAGWSGSRFGTAIAAVQACVTPWPAAGPYQDPIAPSTNFETWYCRDQGNLPAVTAVAGGNVPNQAGVDELLREFFFEDPTVNPNTNKHDAVGMLVWENEERLSPRAWYAKKFNKPAPAGTVKVDGYEAMRVGTTMYVAGTNLAGGTLYTNVYVLGYNDDAGQEIVSIYNQMLERLRLNTNSSLFSYDSVDILTALQQVRRDTDRMGDLMDYRRALATYDERNNRFPELAAGTYLSGMSTSKWPSWNETFGAALGSAGAGTSHVDPVNDFSPACGDPYDPNTCWNELDKRFLCPTSQPYPQSLPYADSHIYAYQTEDAGNSYDLFAHLEYGGAGSWQTGRIENPCSGHPGSECSCFNYQFHDSGGTGGPRDVTPPTVPQNVTASAEAGRMRVVWELSSDPGGSGVQTYRIFRSANGVNFSYFNSIDHPVEGVWIAPIPCATTYYWRVKAKDNAGNESGFSNTAQATTPPCGDLTAPGNVGSFTANPGDGSAALSWTAPPNPPTDDLTAVELYRRNGAGNFLRGDPGATRVNPDATPSETSRAVTGLANGQQYTFGLFPYDEVPNYATGAFAQATPQPAGAYGANVENFLATGDVGKMRLTWTNPAHPDYAGVTIRRKTNDPTPFSGPTDGQAVGDFPRPDFRYDDLAASNPADTYYYAGFAHNNVPEYASGVFSSGSPLGAGVVQNVAGFTAVAGDAQVLLTWTNPAGPYAGALIRRKTSGYPINPADGALVADVLTPLQSHLDQGLANGTTYFYKAFAHDNVPNYATGAPAQATPDNTPPLLLNVKVPPASIELTSAVVTWQTDEPADSRIQVGDAPGPPYDFSLSDGTAVTDHVLTIPPGFLLPNKLYYFRVASENAAGQRTTDIEHVFLTDVLDGSGIRWHGYYESILNTTWNGSLDPAICDNTCNQHYSCAADGTADCNDPQNAPISAGTSCGALARADCLDGVADLPHGRGTLSPALLNAWASGGGSRLASQAEYDAACQGNPRPIGMPVAGDGVWMNEQGGTRERAVFDGQGGVCSQNGERLLDESNRLLIIDP